MGRRFGQHFLVRKSILDAIADAACPASTALVIEIGPGRGALTEGLLDRAPRVVAIEVDPVLVHYLRQKFANAIAAQRLTVIEGDVLQTDLGAWGPAAIAGNLPYYITSPILERTFAAAHWTQAVFLVQAEVAARLCAEPGKLASRDGAERGEVASREGAQRVKVALREGAERAKKHSARDYGYLSVAAQCQAHVERLLEVPAAAFRPPPKVESSVVSMMPRDPATFGIADLRAFLRFASFCFRHKRKTLRNNLSGVYSKDVLDALPEGKLRAEQLGIADLARLMERLSARAA